MMATIDEIARFESTSKAILVRKLAVQLGLFAAVPAIALGLLTNFAFFELDVAIFFQIAIFILFAAMPLLASIRRRKTTVVLYQSGVSIDDEWIDWQAIKKVRYRKIEAEPGNRSYEWIFETTAKTRKVLMNAADPYIDTLFLNEFLIANVSNFRDETLLA
jgi:hypothetical protein